MLTIEKIDRLDRFMASSHRRGRHGLRTVAVGLGLLIGMILGSQVMAQSPVTYHVNARFGDDRNSGTSFAAAWRTIARANSAVQPGDTVFIYGGPYRETIAPRQSGAPSERITYRAVPGETVIIEGARRLVDLSGKSYITVKGITFRDPQYGWGEIRDGHHNELIENTFEGNATEPQAAFSGLYLYAGSSYNRIWGNVFRDWGAALADEPWGDSVRLTNAPYNLIERNAFINAGHALLGVDASYNMIRNNYFENSWSMAVEIAWWKNPSWARGEEFPARRNVFDGNVVIRATRLPNRQDDGFGVHVAAAETIIRRNVLVENEAGGIFVNGWSIAPHAYGNRIYHNTLVANGAPGVIATNWGHAQVDVSDLVLKNNLFSQNDSSGTGVQILFNFWPASTYDTAYFRDAAMIAGNCLNQAPTVDIGSLDGERSILYYQQQYPQFVMANRDGVPRFVNPGAGDYRLQRGRCLDAGVSLTTTTVAGSGTVVPVLDASYFTDGYGLVPGDRVKIGSNPAVLVLQANNIENKLVVERAVNWKRGDPVYLGEFDGRSPDAGAFEFNQ